MHLIDKDPMTPEMKAKMSTSSVSATSTPKSSLSQALKNKAQDVRKKMSAPLTKALRYFPDKHHKYQMEKSDKEYRTLKAYNDYKKSGRPFVESKANSKGVTGDARMITEAESIINKYKNK